MGSLGRGAQTKNNPAHPFGGHLLREAMGGALGCLPLGLPLFVLVGRLSRNNGKVRASEAFDHTAVDLPSLSISQKLSSYSSN